MLGLQPGWDGDTVGCSNLSPLRQGPAQDHVDITVRTHKCQGCSASQQEIPLVFNLPVLTCTAQGLTQGFCVGSGFRAALYPCTKGYKGLGTQAAEREPAPRHDPEIEIKSNLNRERADESHWCSRRAAGAGCMLCPLTRPGHLCLSQQESCSRLRFETHSLHVFWFVIICPVLLLILERHEIRLFSY